MTDILHRKISDLVITIPIFVIGFGLISWLFYFDISIHNRSLFDSINDMMASFPILYAAIYLWLRAVVEDIVRIKRRIVVTWPGMVFFVYGFQWVTIWMANDLLYNNMLVRSGIVSPVKTYLLFTKPVLLWIIIDALVWLTLRPYHFLFGPEGNKTEGKYLYGHIVSLSTFLVSCVISLVL